jgi:hypothetical protein
MYGTGYQLRYVYHNDDAEIVVEYIMDISNFFKFGDVIMVVCRIYYPP